MLSVVDLKVILGDLSLIYNMEVAAGQVAVIRGASGAGKSTLLDLIAGFRTPDDGRIQLDGESLLKHPPDSRPVSSLFQQHNLFNHLSVMRNVALGLHPGLGLSKAQWASVDATLDAVGLTRHKNRLPGGLSGGEQQRVALARCLVRAQPVLLLDEPFSALDPEIRESMQVLLRQHIARQKPHVVLVSHDAADADTLADQVHVMKNGELHETTSW